MIRSFRFRLALLSALLTGAVVSVFSLGAWWLVRETRIERLDRDVRAHAEREVTRDRDPAEWRHIEARIAADLGIRNPDALTLWVMDASGTEAYRSRNWPGAIDVRQLPWPSPGRRPPDRPAPDPERAPPASRSLALDAPGQHWRLGLAGSAHARVAVAVEGAAIAAEMAGIRNALLLALPFALLLSGLGGWLVSRRALGPVAALTRAARTVTARGLDHRLDSRGEDREFVELITVFNGMLERLERSFEQAHRFSADAAHELKTPLAILQGQLERAIQQTEAGSSTQRTLAGILDEVRRLSTISRKLLLLAQADAGRLSLHRAPFDLSGALADLAEDARMLAPELRIDTDLPARLIVSADGSLLQQVLHNLVSNAIKYNVEGGWIRIAASGNADGARFSLSNASRGIAPEQQARLFQRFYRADPARSRKIEGVGLGLALSQEIVRAHGGEMSLQVLEDNSVRVTVTLPGPFGEPTA